MASRKQEGDDARVVVLTPPPGLKDVGECTFEQIMKRIAKAADYTLDQLNQEYMLMSREWKYPAGLVPERLSENSKRPGQRTFYTRI